jgi:pyocin large subunit-like protein
MEFCSIEIVPLQNQPFFSIKGWLIGKNSWTDTSYMKFSRNSADNAWFAYDAESLFTGNINRWTRNSCQEAL